MENEIEELQAAEGRLFYSEFRLQDSGFCFPLPLKKALTYRSFVLKLSFRFAGVVKLVDAGDSKSPGP
jgi:hypothetical protein